MALVTIELPKDLFSSEQKRTMIERVTDAMVSVEGESLRDLTQVRIHETEQKNWGVGGKQMSPALLQKLTAA